jgi:hypothetical protein
VSSGIRDASPNVLQPALLANGTMMTWLTRLSEDHGLTALALEDQPLENLVDRLFLRLFTRPPSAKERAEHIAALREGYDSRRTFAQISPPASVPRRKYVSWSNHNIPEANSLRLEEEAEAKQGDPPTARLAPDWRSRFEDVLWAMLNAPEWARIM